MRTASLSLAFYFLTAVASPAYAKKVRVAFGISLPPYVISEENRGIEFDVIKESLEHKGYELEPVYMAFIEVGEALLENRADAIATAQQTAGIDGYYSDTVITYRNSAITLKNKEFKIESVSDLAGKRIVAFQLATKYLGPEFAAMANFNPGYREKSDQRKQVKMLLDEKTDAVVSDKNIFKYFYKQLRNEGYPTQDIAYYDVFAPNEYSVAFKDKAVRDDFNEGLRKLKTTEKYKEILGKYIQ